LILSKKTEKQESWQLTVRYLSGIITAVILLESYCNGQLMQVAPILHISRSYITCYHVIGGGQGLFLCLIIYLYVLKKYV
jgi:hypothetical protein